jgi:hypothetical protein
MQEGHLGSAPKAYVEAIAICVYDAVDGIWIVMPGED